MAMGRTIITTEDVKLFLDELLNILLEKHYFSYRKDARLYVDWLTHYAEQYIGIFPGKDAPVYFSRYGSDLKYITYRANKTTAWYIFYQQKENIFLIRHITNNHVAAQHFD
jgi:hypothetical protein